MMKHFLLQLLLLSGIMVAAGQGVDLSPKQLKDIQMLIDQYSLARETKDTALLKKILTAEVDQLVSTGEWRTGIAAAVDGMMKSSNNNPGSRTLTVNRVRLLTAASCIVDCRYEIEGMQSGVRKMWSTFIVIADKDGWKISAIRNMLPGAP